MRGDEAYVRGDFRAATRFYEKALDIAPYMHEAQFRLGKAYFLRGRLEHAERAFKHARFLAKRSEARLRYDAKLSALRRWRFEGQSLR